MTTNARVAAVVVGIDGSEVGADALRWAFAEARLRKAPLRVVHAFEFADAAGIAGGYGYFGIGIPVPVTDQDGLRRAAQGMLDDAVKAVAGEFAGVDVECQVIDGEASEVLIAAVEAGDLLVVGSRGHSKIAELLLGSVSQKCVHYASCPVVVVHPAVRGHASETNDSGYDDRSVAAPDGTFASDQGGAEAPPVDT